MPSGGEPLELQLQRERVARSQVEAALEMARLQLIEMEHALRRARENASACLSAASTTESAAPPTIESPPPAPVAEPASTSASSVRSRPRRTAAAKSSSASLVEVARAAEAIEKRSRAGDKTPALTTMTGMVAVGGDRITSTLDLHINDHRALVSDFVAHLQTRLSKMQACYGSGSLTELKWHVHWISENAGGAGFATLTGPARELETVIDQQQNDRIPGLLDAVIQMGERVTVESVRR